MTRFTTMELHHANNEGKKEMLYGIELDHSDSKKGNPLQELHGILSPISSKRSIPQT